jgi:2-aminoadipate transaminase
VTIEERDSAHSEGGAHRSRGASRTRDFDRYSGLFASRTRAMQSSAMRDLMALTERDDVISLAGGLPDTSTFPSDSYAALMGQVAAQSCARALQYGPTDGSEVIKHCIVEVMAAERMRIGPSDLLVTTGGQQAIDLLCKALIDPGDVIIAEGPTYPGAIPTFCAYEADVIQIALDDDGMRVQDLETTLDALEREGRRPKFLYTVPSFQNPAGVTMSLERRHALIQIARERELLIMEDNPYGMLRYEGEPLPTLYSLDDEFVIYTGTFSKILSPGVRLGWAVAPAPILDQMQSGKQGTDLCSSPITQYFVAAYFDSGPWEDYLGSLVEIYRRRRDVMLDAMAEHFPREADWTHPQGGLFIWATLPDYIDTTDMLARALRQNVAFVPGRAAYLDGRGGSAMRLNFSGVAEDQIREGIRRIGAIASEQVAMYGTLSGAARPSRRRAASQAGDGEPLAPVVRMRPGQRRAS